MGKTEGNGCVNDFTRGYATLALKVLLAERLACTMAAVEQRIHYLGYAWSASFTLPAAPRPADR